MTGARELPPPVGTPGGRDWLAAQMAIGLLDGPDQAAAESLAETDPAFAGLVAAWRRRLAELDDTAAEREPPAHLLPAILARLDAEAGTADRAGAADPAESSRPATVAGAARAEAASGQGDVPTASATPTDAQDPAATLVPFSRPGAARAGGRWNSVSLWRGAAAAASLVAAVALGTLLLAPKPRPELVAVLLVEPGKPGAVVEAFADGRVRLVPLQDLPVPAGRALQVWTLRDRAQGPISVGLMPRARTLPLDLGTLPETAPDQLFEITLEPETGSPTGRPTGPILMKGLAARTL